MTNLAKKTVDQSSTVGLKLKTAAPWWKGAVIYQIYPRSFRDSNGDGIGDIPGIIDGLDHVASLGVDAIWLSPFFKSPMDDFGYDVADYLDVDPMFGTLEDFDRLIEKAHALELKVIIDQVYSHTSDQHAWFEQSRSSRDNPKADWYVWADPKPDGSPPTNWQSVFGGAAWEWDNVRRQYYLHNFLKSQPDLNVHNPDVQEAILDVARFWLDRGVDGFRLDALNFSMHDLEMRDNPPARVFHRPPTRPFDFQDHIYNMSHPKIPAFLERIRGVMDEYDERFTVAEVGGDDSLDEMKAFTADDKRLNSAYSFEFLYADKLTPELVASTFDSWPGKTGEGWPSWAFSNHDAPRAISRWVSEDNQEKAAKLYMMLLLSLRGNAFIYQGEELGLCQADVAFEHLQDPEAIANWPETLGRDGARTPLPWTSGEAQSGFTTGAPWIPLDERHDAAAIDTQNSANDSMLQFTRQMVSVRHQTPALAKGSVKLIKADDQVLVFDRELDGDVYQCVFNLSEQVASDAPLAREKVRLVEVGLEAGSPDNSLPPLSGYIARK